MAELKTKVNEASVDEFLAAFPEETRKERLSEVDKKVLKELIAESVKVMKANK